MLLKLGVILPHLKVFGGVKRFFEIGNLLIASGHSFTIFTPAGTPPDWFDFRGDVRRTQELEQYSFDALFITEPEFLPLLKSSDARLRIFYAVLERRSIRKVARQQDIIILANSGRLYRYLGGGKNPNIVQALGGIDIQKFHYKPRVNRQPGDPFTVMVYGRFYRKKKGTMHVIKACERLYKKGLNINVMLFDTPVDEATRIKIQRFSCKVPFRFFVDYPVKNIADLYHQADVFVSAERNAGWSNTAAEAMACGVPVIATRSGTEDFVIDGQTGLVVWRHSWFIGRALQKLYDDPVLGKKLSVDGRAKIEAFTWEKLARTIETMVIERCQNAG